MQGQPGGRTELWPHICSVGSSWCVDGTGWPLDVPLCLYRFSHCETCGGWTESCGLSFFLSFCIFFSDVYPGRSAVFPDAAALHLSAARVTHTKKETDGFSEAKIHVPVEAVSAANILDTVTDSLRQLELLSWARRLKSDINGRFPTRCSRWSAERTLT